MSSRGAGCQASADVQAHQEELGHLTLSRLPGGICLSSHHSSRFSSRSGLFGPKPAHLVHLSQPQDLALHSVSKQAFKSTSPHHVVLATLTSESSVCLLGVAPC